MTTTSRVAAVTAASLPDRYTTAHEGVDLGAAREHEPGEQILEPRRPVQRPGRRLLVVRRQYDGASGETVEQHRQHRPPDAGPVMCRQQMQFGELERVVEPILGRVATEFAT